MNAASPRVSRDPPPVRRGFEAVALRLAVAAVLPVGFLALLFSNFGALSPSFGASAPHLPNAAFAVVPDFTPIGTAARPEADSVLQPAALAAARERPRHVRLASARLIEPRPGPMTSFQRYALADPRRICAAIRVGEESAAWGTGAEGFAAFECMSSQVVAADVAMIPLPESEDVFADEVMADDPALEPQEPLEPQMMEAPPKRSLFTIARGESGDAVGFVRLKILGETVEEARLAAGDGADALRRLFVALGWPLPAGIADDIAALHPLDVTIAGTRLFFAREGGEGERYNLSILFPDSRRFARGAEAFAPRPVATVQAGTARPGPFRLGEDRTAAR